MEFLLRYWDELDDVAGAFRHVASTALTEAASLSKPLMTWGSALGIWLLVPQLRVDVALLASSVTFFELYRRLLRLPA